MGVDSGLYYRLESKPVRPLCQTRPTRRYEARLLREKASRNCGLGRGVRGGWHSAAARERHLAGKAGLSTVRVAERGRKNGFGNRPGNRHGNGSHRGSDCDLQTDLAAELQAESEHDSRRKLRVPLRMQTEMPWRGESLSDFHRDFPRDMRCHFRFDSQGDSQGGPERDCACLSGNIILNTAGAERRLRLYSPARTAIICRRPYRNQNREEKL